MTMLAGELGGLAHQPGDHEWQCRDEQQDLQAFDLVGAMQFEAEAETGALHIPKARVGRKPRRGVPPNE